MCFAIIQTYDAMLITIKRHSETIDKTYSNPDIVLVYK